VPELINHEAPIIASASVALDKVGDQQVLGDIVRSIDIVSSNYVEPLVSGGEFDLEQLFAIEAKHQQLKEDVEGFFLAAFDRSEPASALDYLHDNQLQWDGEMWLFQVIAEHEGLAYQLRQRFDLVKDKSYEHQFSHVEVIGDVTLGVNL